MKKTGRPLSMIACALLLAGNAVPPRPSRTPRRNAPALLLAGSAATHGPTATRQLLVDRTRKPKRESVSHRNDSTTMLTCENNATNPNRVKLMAAQVEGMAVALIRVRKTRTLVRMDSRQTLRRPTQGAPSPWRKQYRFRTDL